MCLVWDGDLLSKNMQKITYLWLRCLRSFARSVALRESISANLRYWIHNMPLIYSCIVSFQSGLQFYQVSQPRVLVIDIISTDLFNYIMMSLSIMIKFQRSASLTLEA